MSEVLVREYISFLEQLEVGVPSIEHIPHSNVPDLPANIDKKIARFGLGGLDDHEVVQVYATLGAANSNKHLPLDLKIAQFTELAENNVFEGMDSMAEFGCGTGLLSAFVKRARLVQTVLGLDGCAEYCVAARSLCESLQIDAGFICRMADRSGFPDRSYDLVLSVDLLDCSRNWREILLEMIRVANKRLAIIYCTSSSIRRINPAEVVQMLQDNSMMVDAISHFNPSDREDYRRMDSVIISASRVESKVQSSELIVVSSSSAGNTRNYR